IIVVVSNFPIFLPSFRLYACNFFSFSQNFFFHFSSPFFDFLFYFLFLLPIIIIYIISKKVKWFFKNFSKNFSGQSRRASTDHRPLHWARFRPGATRPRQGGLFLFILLCKFEKSRKPL